jgi:acyl-CoA reductase-like NAD-dependent aldehyde dehydrogenase
MKDEIFGPILPIIPYQNIDEAIKYINDGEKPLALYYFGSQNGQNSKRIERETSSGAFAVNEVLYQVTNCDLPFGGVGYSGYGRYHGFEGFKAFSNMKSCLIKPPVKMYPYNKTYPPYPKDK